MKIISRFQLSGLTCSSCEKIITKKLNTIEGITDIQVSSINGIVSVVAPKTISTQEIETSLQGTHYKVITDLL